MKNKKTKDLLAQLAMSVVNACMIVGVFSFVTMGVSHYIATVPAQLVFYAVLLAGSLAVMFAWSARNED